MAKGQIERFSQRGLSARKIKEEHLEVLVMHLEKLFTANVLLRDQERVLVGHWNLPFVFQVGQAWIAQDLYL